MAVRTWGTAMYPRVRMYLGVLLTVSAALTAVVGGVEAAVTEPDAAEESPHRDAGPLQAALRADFPNQFGGMWIDETNGITIAIVDDSDAIRARASATLEGPVRYASVTRSEAALAEIHAEILRIADDTFSIGGLELVSVETDVKANKVAVRVLNGTSEQVATLQERLGPGVSVTAANERIMGRSCTAVRLFRQLRTLRRLQQLRATNRRRRRSSAGRWLQA